MKAKRITQFPAPPPTRRRTRRLVRGVIRLGVLLGVGLLLVGLVRRNLDDWVAELLGGQTGYRISLNGLSFSFPDRVQLDSFSLADTNGVWCLGSDLRVEASVPSLLRGPILIRAVSVQDFELQRLPVRSERAIPSSEPPRAWSLERLTAGQARLAKPVLGVALDLEAVTASLMQTGAVFRVDGDGQVTLAGLPSVALAGAVQHDPEGWHGTLRAAAPAWTAGTVALPASMTTVEGSWQDGQIDVRAAWSEDRVETVRIRLQGPLSRIAFEAEIDSPLGRPLVTAGKGVLAREPGRIDLDLDPLDLTYAGTRIDLRTPAHIRLGEGEWKTGPLGITINQQLEVDLEASLLGSNCSAHVVCEALPLSRLPAIRRWVTTGTTARVAAELTGTLQDPILDWEVTPFDLEFQDSRLKPLSPIRTALTGHYGSGLMHAALNATNRVAGHAGGDLIIPARISLLPFIFSLDAQSLHQATLQTDLRLNVINELPLTGDHVIQGRVELNLAYNGDTKELTATGPCRIENGSYENLALGTVIQKIQATFTPQGQTVVVEDATADDKRGGTYRTRAVLDFTDVLRPSLQASITLNQATVVNSDAVTASGSGDITVRLDPGEVTLDGTFRVSAAEVRLDRLPPPPPLSMVVVERGNAADPPPLASPPPPPAPRRVRGMLRVDIPSGLLVRGLGMDSSWSGQLSVSAEEGPATLVGELAAARGNINFLGRRFVLINGKLFFQGGDTALPTIDLQAEHVRGELTARLRIRGSLNQPAFDLTSTPSYPHDEILARVLFGRSRDTITPAQAAQLALAVRSLREGNRGGGWNLAGRLKEAVGIERVEIREEGEADSQAELVIGKYTRGGAYVEFSESLGREGGSSVRLEKELGRSFSVETDAGSRMRPGIGLNWRHDY